jgi:F0F1-type ATP synthase delta subunit
MLTNSNAGYATVLFQLGKSNDVLDVYYQNTQAFLDLLRNTPNMYEFVGNANIPKIERKKIIKRIFSRRLDQNFIYFIWAIIDFQRGHDIISILKSFMRLYEEYCGIVFVRISSA